MNHNPYTAYLTATGKIQRAGFCSQSDVLLQAIFPGEAVIEVFGNELTQYVADGELLSRPVVALSDCTLAIDEDLVLTDVPVGTVVYVDDVEAGVLDEPTLTISFPVAGIWQLRLDTPFPCIGASCEVTVA